MIRSSVICVPQIGKKTLNQIRCSKSASPSISALVPLSTSILMNFAYPGLDSSDVGGYKN